MKILIALLALCFAAQATDIYVSASGSGTGCTSGTPCTFSQGVSNFSSGTAATIHVANGTYSNSVDILKSGGSTSSRLVFQCDNGIASAAVARGKCLFNHAWLIEANNIDIVGFDIGGSASLGVAIDIICNSTSAIACPHGNSVHVIGNYIHDLGQSVSSSSGQAGCPENGAVTAGAHNHTITDTQYLRNWVVNFGINPAPSGCHVAQGLYFSNAPTGSPTIVENNVVINTAVSGIQNSEGDCNFVISNNTIIGSKHAIILQGSPSGVGCSASASSSFTIANNAFFGSQAAFAGTDGYVFHTSGAADCNSNVHALWSHNISDGATTDFDPSRSTCDTVSPSPLTHQSGASFFASYQPNGSGDYHLRTGSVGIATGSTACANGGTSPCTPSADFEGNTLSAVAALDVGAYKASGGTVSKPNPPTGLTAIVH